MQIPTWLGALFSSGKIAFSVREKKVLQLEAKSKQIALDVMDRKIIKEVLEAGGGAEEKPLKDILGQLEKFAEELKGEGLTITISHKGDKVLTLGETSDSKLSQLVTGTGAIEINNLSKLIRMVI